MSKVHYRYPFEANAYETTACGLRLDGQKSIYGTNYRISRFKKGTIPTWSNKLEAITCRACLRSKWVRELKSEWPLVKVLSNSFELEGMPESSGRLLTIRIMVSSSEAHVLTTLMLEKFQNLLQDPDLLTERAFRAYREFQLKKPPPKKIERPKWTCSKCGGEGTEPHTCPFAEYIYGDYTTECTCCEACTEECAMDI